jgi:hypothetical protein
MIGQIVDFVDTDGRPLSTETKAKKPPRFLKVVVL